MNTKQPPELKRPSLQRIHDVDAYTPYSVLKDKLSLSTHQAPVTGVCHWFRNKDLRVEDNTALYHAFQKATASCKPLVTVYLYCPHALIRQGISKARFAFILDTLTTLQSDLDSLNIPLTILTIDKLSDTKNKLLQWLKPLHISDLYANYEYEVDELRRDTQVVDGIQATINCCYYHDQCVVEPGTLLNQQKNPLKVYTHYHTAWVDCVKHAPSLAKTSPRLSKQSVAVRKQLTHLFKAPFPTAPSEKRFASSKEAEALRVLWPVGHAAALKKLDYFIEHHLNEYATTRNCPALDSTSKMSPYLAIGAISVRTILEKLIQHNAGHYDFSLSSSSMGVFGWVRELVFREFFRQQLVITPHLSMNTPQNPKFAYVHWEEDETGWKKWCEGKTGVPWIDAGMRQLKKEAYMHNRLRMNVASYLYNTLLIDYRRGERYFAEMLIDWDLANNTQGWSPSYTAFNPILQAEKNDPQGDYIRKWVPELSAVKGKAIFNPYHSLTPTEFQKLNYPKPYANWEKNKERARSRFKEALKGT